MEIQDMFVINRGGLPYFSKCYGGSTCHLNPDHALQTGFLAAIYSFSGEFGQKTLEIVKFEELMLIFKLIKDIDSILVFVVLASDDIPEVEGKMEAVASIFLEKYGSKATTSRIIRVDDFAGFGDDLERILDKKPGMDIQLRKKPSLWQRIKGKWL
ncbi:MAG: hypothetical protein ACE5OZ_17705 [Candidatus Heimdallarchaeota archaeon]